MEGASSILSKQFQASRLRSVSDPTNQPAVREGGCAHARARGQPAGTAIRRQYVTRFTAPTPPITVQGRRFSSLPSFAQVIAPGDSFTAARAATRRSSGGARRAAALAALVLVPAQPMPFKQALEVEARPGPSEAIAEALHAVRGPAWPRPSARPFPGRRARLLSRDTRASFSRTFRSAHRGGQQTVSWLVSVRLAQHS